MRASLDTLRYRNDRSRLKHGSTTYGLGLGPGSQFELSFSAADLPDTEDAPRRSETETRAGVGVGTGTGMNKGAGAGGEGRVQVHRAARATAGRLEAAAESDGVTAEARLGRSYGALHGSASRRRSGRSSDDGVVGPDQDLDGDSDGRVLAAVRARLPDRMGSREPGNSAGRASAIDDGNDGGSSSLGMRPLDGHEGGRSGATMKMETAGGGSAAVRDGWRLLHSLEGGRDEGHKQESSRGTSSAAPDE